MKTNIAPLKNDYLRLYKEINSVQSKLVSSVESIILDSVSKANSKGDLDKLIQFLEIEVPKSIVLDRWYQLIHSKYITL